MFKTYGIIGIFLIAIVELNFLLRLEPLASWYFIIGGIGYILLIDAINKNLNRKSLISDKPLNFLGIAILSVLFWSIFEIVNFKIQAWNHLGSPTTQASFSLFKILYYAVVLPSIFETAELIRSIHLFEKVKLKNTLKIKKVFLYSLIFIGILCFFLPLYFPKVAFPLIWVSFFFLLDPINYINKQPSIIRKIKEKRLAIPLSIFSSGIFVGLIWEFWNFWSLKKWVYDLPYLTLFKIFEMPVLGYLGYGFFALELYAMYWFTRSLFIKGEKQLK